MSTRLKAAIVVLADTETHEGMGRVANALEAVKEFKEHGDDVRLIFDGAGVKWVVALSNPEHKLHGLYQSSRQDGRRLQLLCGCLYATDVAIECKLKFWMNMTATPVSGFVPMAIRSLRSNI